MSAVDLTPRAFKKQARAALEDVTLRQALGRARTGFVEHRAAAVARLPEFELLRDEAEAIKNDALERLDESRHVLQDEVLGLDRPDSIEQTEKTR